MSSWVEEQLTQLKCLYKEATVDPLPNGSHLVCVPEYSLPSGWQLPPSADNGKVTIKFLAPPGYPAAKPDCFWISPTGIRLAGGNTPQNTNDSNPIPGLQEAGPHGTWFSWHVQRWDPSCDTLVTFMNSIKQRLNPPR